MKFARKFRADLQAYPPEWVGTAMHYGSLKKCLKSVRRDLEGLGLDESTLRQLLAARTAASPDSSHPTVQYRIEGAYGRHLSASTAPPKPTGCDAQ